MSTEYGILDVLDEVPAPTRGPLAAPRKSPLNDVIETVVNDPEQHGKAVCIALYDKQSTCAGAAASARQRYGRDGAFHFATRKQAVKQDGEVVDKHALWMIYNPAA